MYNIPMIETRKVEMHAEVSTGDENALMPERARRAAPVPATSSRWAWMLPYSKLRHHTQQHLARLRKISRITCITVYYSARVMSVVD